MSREILELEDEGVSGIKLRLAAAATLNPILIVRTFDDGRTGPCVVLSRESIAKLMDYLTRNFDNDDTSEFVKEATRKTLERNGEF